LFLPPGLRLLFEKLTGEATGIMALRCCKIFDDLSLVVAKDVAIYD
jgi:hypothetical protein